ncbi:hypothetical protein STENM327S_02844 [Streptomyces tendae]
MITGVGTGWAFLANGLSFVAPLSCLLLMRPASCTPSSAPRAARASCARACTTSPAAPS